MRQDARQDRAGTERQEVKDVTELPVVVGVDGSESSLLAVDWAVDAAARHGQPLRLVHASLWERYEGYYPDAGTEQPSTERVLREHLVASAAERARLRNPEVKVSADIVPDDAVSVLLAEGRNASSLVTGSRGRGEIAGLLLGSVSLALAARADCPVIVVRGAGASGGSTAGYVVLGVDDRHEDAAAARFAFREASARGCELHAVRAWRCPAHEMPDHPLVEGHPAAAHHERAVNALETSLRAAAEPYPEVSVRREAVEGPPRKVLLDAAAGAGLLVVGAHRRQGLFGLQLGLVGHTVLHHADCPVAIVPEHI